MRRWRPSRTICRPETITWGHLPGEAAKATTFTCSCTPAPKVQPSKPVTSLKGVSARLLRKEYSTHVRRYPWDGHFWPGSYFAGSCGGAPLTAIRQYIENQQRPT